MVRRLLYCGQGGEVVMLLALAVLCAGAAPRLARPHAVHALLAAAQACCARAQAPCHGTPPSPAPTAHPPFHTQIHTHTHIRTYIPHRPYIPPCPAAVQITEGSGKILVLAVGEHSDWGRTMTLVMGEAEDTPLQEKLGWLATAIGKLGLVVAVICFIVLMVRWEEGDGRYCGCWCVCARGGVVGCVGGG